MIHLDTSALVDAITGARRSQGKLRELADRGELMSISAPVLYEWLRGPRSGEEIDAQELLFPSETAAAFGPGEAALAAELYRRVPRAREFDLAVAACAISQGAALRTLNRRDFEGVPGLTLV